MKSCVKLQTAMILRVRLVLLLCALAGSAVTVLQRELQYSTNGGCYYQGQLVKLWTEYVPVYDPYKSEGCVRVLCKTFNATQLEMAVHSCNPQYVDGKPVELWPGKRYPDCCRKLRY